jgi:hypothetical protein
MLQLSSKEAAWDIGSPVKTQLSAPIQANAEVKKVLH